MEYSDGVITLHLNKFDDKARSNFLQIESIREAASKSDIIQIIIPGEIVGNNELVEGYLAYILAIAAPISDREYYTQNKIRRKGIFFAQNAFQSETADKHLIVNFLGYIPHDLLLIILEKVKPIFYRRVNKQFNEISKEPRVIITYYSNMYGKSALAMYEVENKPSNPLIVSEMKQMDFYSKFKEKEKLVGTEIINISSQGASVALSYDGKVLAVGGPNDNWHIGATWIFTKENGQWRQEAKLVGLGVVNQSQQGHSVALSFDGKTLAVGGPGDNDGTGAIWIFNKEDENWIEETKLIGLAGIGANQGQSVALSSDGKTLAAGGPKDNGGIGAVWIFNKETGQWLQEAKLSESSNIGNSNQGYSVALASNGAILAVGSPEDNNNTGAVWIFIKENGQWIKKNKLVDPNKSTKNLGLFISLSLNGDILVTSDYRSTTRTWIFDREVKEWINGDRLSIQGGDSQCSVALSSDGRTLAIGFPGYNHKVGSTWIFDLDKNNHWINEGVFIGQGYLGPSRQGHSVALSGNNYTLASGGLTNSTPATTFSGMTWIFERE